MGVDACGVYVFLFVRQLFHRCYRFFRWEVLVDRGDVRVGQFLVGAPNYVTVLSRFYAVGSGNVIRAALPDYYLGHSVCQAGLASAV